MPDTLCRRTNNRHYIEDNHSHVHCKSDQCGKCTTFYLQASTNSNVYYIFKLNEMIFKDEWNYTDLPVYLYFLVWLRSSVIMNRYTTKKASAHNTGNGNKDNSKNNNFISFYLKYGIKWITEVDYMSSVARFIGPTWDPSGSCRPQMGPMLAPWTLLSGLLSHTAVLFGTWILYKIMVPQTVHCRNHWWVASKAKPFRRHKSVGIIKSTQKRDYNYICRCEDFHRLMLEIIYR